MKNLVMRILWLGNLKQILQKQLIFMERINWKSCQLGVLCHTLATQVLSSRFQNGSFLKGRLKLYLTPDLFRIFQITLIHRFFIHLYKIFYHRQTIHYCAHFIHEAVDVKRMGNLSKAA